MSWLDLLTLGYVLLVVAIGLLWTARHRPLSASDIDATGLVLVGWVSFVIYLAASVALGMDLPIAALVLLSVFVGGVILVRVTAHNYLLGWRVRLFGRTPGAKKLPPE